MIELGGILQRIKYMSPLHANQTILYNVVNVFLLATGMIGLLCARLIFIPGEFPKTSSITRMVGFIFLLPVLFNALGLSGWFDLRPAVVCILGAFILVRLTIAPARSQAFQFWFMAMIPAIGLFLAMFTATQLTSWWGQFVEFGHKSALPESFWTLLLLLLFKFLFPVITAFVVNRIAPVVPNTRQGLLFALPSFLFYVQYSVTGWILPTIEAIQHPELPYPDLTTFIMVDTFVGLSLLLSISIASWLGSRIGTTP